jgi:hypothetical protein
LAKYQLKNPQPLVIADLFGGDGEFLEQVLQKLPSQTEVSQAAVIDRNGQSLTLAQKRFGLTPNIKTIQKKLTQDEDLFDGLAGRPNLVTAIGGLCQSVITRDQALTVAQRAYDQMAAGGVFLATGYSPMLLNAAHFRDIGYKVEQMAIASQFQTAPTLHRCMF